MGFLSMQQAVTLLCICSFALGLLVNRVYNLFYEQYVALEEDDEASDQQEAI